MNGTKTLKYTILTKPINPTYKRIYTNIAMPKHIIVRLLEPFSEVFDSKIYSGVQTLRLPGSYKYDPEA